MSIIKVKETNVIKKLEDAGFELEMEASESSLILLDKAKEKLKEIKPAGNTADALSGMFEEVADIFDGAVGEGTVEQMLEIIPGMGVTDLVIIFNEIVKELTAAYQSMTAQYAGSGAPNQSGRRRR